MIDALKIFHEPGDVIEIRIIEGNGTTAGYFKDIDKAIEQVKKYNGKFNIYFVLNKVLEPCYHRCPDTLQQKIKKTTTDNDVEQRRWILLDYDPKRPAEISAADEEKAASYERMKEANKFLRSQGFPYPVVADSGNGWHNLYKINLSNNTESMELVKKFLQAMDMLFSDEKVQVDTAVFNAARITKLYGTIAAKGANTKERPHRISGITYKPDQIEEVSVELIQKICSMLPKPEVKQNTGGNYTGAEFDLDNWIQQNNVRVKRVTSWNSNTKYVLEECPFDPAHGKDSAIIKLSSGAISFHCFHNGCANNTWQELRQKYEPGCYDRNERKEYKPKKEYKPERKPEVNLAPVAPKVIDEATRKILEKAKPVKDIKPFDRKNIEVFSMAIPTMDERVEVLFGKIALVTGVNGSGKSTWFSQIMLEALEQGYNVFAYSGELKEDEFQYWTDLQAAGSSFLVREVSKKGKEYYKIKPEAITKIHQWYAERFFLYDNNESMRYEDILKTVEVFREHRGCRVIFLDNFMTMDISDLDEKELKAQTKFIWSLAKYVKANNVLVFLVIHPKKIFEGICQKQDVLGTGNFSNAIDYMFIVHRVNEAFKTHLEKRKISKESKGYLECASNVIEIGKDRWSGKEGLNIAMIYCEDSKRLVDFNRRDLENKQYGWLKKQDEEEQIHGDAYEEEDEICPF